MNHEIETILLVRHARSTANENAAVYRTTPDHTIPLCRPDDDASARLAGETIARLDLDPALVCSWSSTYLRCVQTERLVLAHAFGPRTPEVRQRPSFLLREQEFGDWDCLTEQEMEASDPVRHAKRQRLTDNQGRFYFRYPNGESRADVTQRIAIFIGKIHRSRYEHHVVFLHGVTQRAFRMAWLNRTVDWFEEEPNPPNGSVLMIRRDAEGFWADRYL
ncbi:MAG TPA: histidine phosphatase family protein [Candidatus Nanopelagicales bacterium]|nr:histidine phosphatase family protein [Candidatus Nanopelagicales bacterium]